ncbi:MAG: hypothetical protein JWM74_1187 [Myxococcaceae bacterium]|nr:hypothetical protein [Myxococcaceae bacterium]
MKAAATLLALAFGSAFALGGAACSSASTATSADASTPDAAPTDAEVASSDAKVGDTCSFNRECGKTERCECDEDAGTCVCKTGARGTGKNGVDTCTSGNDCASALCVEGRNKFYCSDECTSNTSCGSALPVCADIAFVGRVCIRDADGG